MRACSSKTSCASSSLRQHFFEKLQRPRIIGLPQPEHCLFSYGRIPIRLSHLDQFAYAFVLRQLGERKDRFFLHIRVEIVLDRSGERTYSFISRFMRQPEKCLPPHASAVLTLRP